MLPPHRFSKASHFLREAFLLLTAFFSCACEAQETTPDWPEQTSKKTPDTTSIRYTKAPKSQTRVTFMVYNLRNYLDMQRGSTPNQHLPKPQHEIDDLLTNILQVKPDILGVCEIGTAADLADLQNRLAQRGWHLAHTYLHGGAAPKRHLAILSRYPLTPHQTANLFYTYEGKPQKMLRGILDVSIQLPSGAVRFLGVHLKSKRPSKYFDQARVRRHEAELLRRHATNILQKQPTQKLIVFGDFNDTKQSAPIRSIVGSKKSPKHLKPIRLRAKNGTTWTHYWAHQDIYSRFDYAFISKAMKSFIDYQRSYVFEPHKDNRASDHRPLIISIR